MAGASRASVVMPAVCAASLVVSIWLLVGAGGWHYYTRPLAVRGYDRAHVLLRPTGVIGHAMGVVGLVMMLVPIAYTVRKKWRALARVGRLDNWLSVHIFCGIFGPVLVTFHTSFKFNGIVSVAYWAMVSVVISGFVGRYLYVRMPRSIRGAEMTYAEIVERASALRARVEGPASGPGALAALDAFEAAIVPKRGERWTRSARVGWLRRRRLIRRLRAALAREGFEPSVAHEAVSMALERAYLLRRLAYLETTKRWFAAWHVFHQPLVYLMFGIAALHVGVAIYLGYTPW